MALMSGFRETLARLIDPDLARRADERDWLVSEIQFERRWLSEFPDVLHTFSRLLELLYERDDSGLFVVRVFHRDIGKFREFLRESRDGKLKKAVELAVEHIVRS